MIRRRSAYLLFAFVLLFSFNIRAAAQEGDSETFPKGFIVSGETLKFYHSVDDPERLFGLPYTIAFPDPIRPNITIQYFDRVRMEYDPSLPEGQRVVLADLGNFAHNDAQPGLLVPTAPNMCQMVYPKPVCYGFRDLYNRYGEKYFGKPITEAEYDDNGRLVQYFTRVRMEWRPEMPTGQKVVLTELGRIDYEKRIGNPLYKDSKNPSVPTKIEPKLFAFVARPLVANGDKQFVYALLYNQNDQPIEDANITIKVTRRDGDSHVIQLLDPTTLKTNKSGYTSLEFSVPNLNPNEEIEIEVTAQIVNGPSSTATTWFRVWW
jgi:hypothetical protein